MGTNYQTCSFYMNRESVVTVFTQSLLHQVGRETPGGQGEDLPGRGDRSGRGGAAGADPGHGGLSLQPLHGLHPGPPPLPRVSRSGVLQPGVQHCSAKQLPQASVVIKSKICP